MATKEMAKMLDELMGRNRDARPGDKIENLTWEDPSVCRYHLTDVCPHDLFTNTKADLGGCPRLHDEIVKEEFSRVKEHKLTGPIYNEYIRFCEKLFSDLNNKIKRSKARLVLTQMEQVASQGISKKQQEEIEEKIIILTDKVNGLVDQAEKAGIEGDVEKATGLLKLVDTLREERNQLKVQIGMTPVGQGPGQPFTGPTSGKFEVCEVCGAILITDDKTARRDDHLMGKQHAGYVRLKGSLDRVSAEQNKRREERERERLAEDVKDEDDSSEENGEVKKDAKKDREKGEISPKDDKSAERKRDKKSKDSKDRKSSDRKRSRSRERKRSRSKDRRRRSKSRDRRRSRSKDRRRDRSRDRGSDRRHR